MSDDDSSFWASQAAMAPDLSDKEKELRDRFVSEYILDFDAYAAAMRIGFGPSFAPTYAEKFLAEPYVQKRLVEFQTAMDADPKAEAELDRRRIRAALLREAHYRGPGSSHAARVSALAKLAQIRDMDAPIKSQVHLLGGVMEVPGIANTESWEEAAVTSQMALKKAATLTS